MYSTCFYYVGYIDSTNNTMSAKQLDLEFDN